MDVLVLNDTGRAPITALRNQQSVSVSKFLPLRLAFASEMATHPWGGSEELWSRAAKHLAQLGHAVAASVVGWQPSARQIVEIRDAGISVVERIETPGSRARKAVRRLLGQSASSIEINRRAAWLQAMRPDLVVVSNAAVFDSVEWMEASRFLKIPFVSVAQANAEHFWPTDAVAKRISDVFFAAEACFFVSNRNRDLFEEQIGGMLSNAEIVRNPFNVEYNAAPDWPETKGQWKLACVARLEPGAKGQDVLLHVLAQPKWIERPLHVTLYGAGACKESLVRLSDRLRLRSVSFAGHVDDVQTIWQRNHALILPSRYEGMPLAVVEAMLCGRPVIVTDVAGNAELVDDGVTGFVALAPTVGLLDAAMERAWAQRLEWRKIGELAARRVRHAIPADPAIIFAERLVDLAKVAARR